MGEDYRLTILILGNHEQGKRMGAKKVLGNDFDYVEMLNLNGKSGGVTIGKFRIIGFVHNYKAFRNFNE